MKNIALTLRFLLPIALGFLAAASAHATDATWLQNPTDTLWTNPNNWAPNTVPNATTDTATFGPSAIPTINVTSPVNVGKITFAPGASTYDLTVANNQSLTLSGSPNIINNSGVGQNFVADGGFFYIFGTDTFDSTIHFEILGANSARRYGTLWLQGNIALGAARVDFEGGDGHNINGGYGVFFSGVTAGAATIVLHRGVNGGHAGSLTFESGYAGAANITAEGSDKTTTGGGYLAFSNANAGTATVTLQRPLIPNGNPATAIFSLFASAAASTLLSDGGALIFTYASTGGTARSVLTNRGSLDLSGLRSDTLGMAIGSVEGDRTGVVSLGAKKLTIGGNNLSTTFAGLIQDVGISGGTGGSLEKVGMRTLTLSGDNNYTGGTTVTEGDFVVTNKTGSATGTGAVQVDGGRFGGPGIVAGAVTIGGTGGSSATLMPALGTNKQVTLVINNALTFHAGATYNSAVNTSNHSADSVAANGATIDPGASFVLRNKGNSALPPGTVITAINNTSALPIFGSFSGLPEGATLAAGQNTYVVSYTGDDGNNFTLTVL